MSDSSDHSHDDDVVVWVRLPRPMSVKELKKMGLDAAACYGGDTCIAATDISPEAGIVVQPDIDDLFRKAKLQPRLLCFGGSSCIV
jgi:hypothetical protein